MPNDIIDFGVQVLLKFEWQIQLSKATYYTKKEQKLIPSYPNVSSSVWRLHLHTFSLPIIVAIKIITNNALIRTLKYTYFFLIYFFTIYIKYHYFAFLKNFYPTF